MASLLQPRMLNRSLLSLPPTLRTTTYLATTTRTFTSTPPRKIDLIPLAVAGPNLILDSIHSLGIPWHTTIPLTAILVRTTFVYYISIRPARKKRQITNALTPLAHAHMLQHWNSKEERDRRRKEYVGYGELGKWADANYTRFFTYRREMGKLSKSHGLVGGRFPWGLLNFGALIAFSEALRLKCGTREGLLPMLLAPVKWLGEKLKELDEERIGGVAAAAKTTPAPVPVSRDPAEVLAERLEAARAKHVAVQQEGLQSQSQSQSYPDLVSDPANQLSGSTTTHAVHLPPAAPVSPRVDPTGPYFDPTTQTEGLPWITNLSLPDPTFALPILFLLTMATGILTRPGSASAAVIASKWNTFKSHGLLGFILNPNPSTNTDTDTNQQTATAPAAATPRQGIPSNLDSRQKLALSFVVGIGFVMTNAPAAVILYFVASVAAGAVQGRWLERRDPILPPIMPCKRSVRVKIRRGW